MYFSPGGAGTKSRAWCPPHLTPNPQFIPVIAPRDSSLTRVRPIGTVRACSLSSRLPNAWASRSPDRQRPGHHIRSLAHPAGAGQCVD